MQYSTSSQSILGFHVTLSGDTKSPFGCSATAAAQDQQNDGSTQRGPSVQVVSWSACFCGLLTNIRPLHRLMVC